MYYHEGKLIFIHIPKTGGISIKNWLTEIYQTDFFCSFFHIKIANLRFNMDPKFYNESFKFTFVRNSWDRAVSYYLYLKNLKEKLEFVPQKDFVFFKTATFKDYLRYKFDTQWSYITYNREVAEFDFIGRFEKFEQDVCKLSNMLNLKNVPDIPHANITAHDHYSKYYNNVTKDIVYRKCKQEIDYFGFQFEYEPIKMV